MSRTLVHRPLHAWFEDPSLCVEVHDHTEGPCDLPTLAEWRKWFNRSAGEQAWWGDPGRWRCGWDLQLNRMPRLCGCRLCTGSMWRRMDRRIDRHRARSALRTGRWRDEYDD